MRKYLSHLWKRFIHKLYIDLKNEMHNDANQI